METEELLSLSKMGILEVDLKGSIQSADIGILNIFDLNGIYNSKEEIKDKKLYAILIIEDSLKETLLRKIKSASTKIERFEIYVKTLKSAIKRFQLNYILSSKERVKILFIDTTETKFSEDKLENLNSMYKALFAAAPIGILLVDHRGIIKEFNNYLAHMFGAKTPDEFVGKDIFSILGLREINFIEDIRTVLEKGTSIAGEKKFMTPYGKSITFSYVIVPVPLYSHEKKISAFAIIEDRTNIK